MLLFQTIFIVATLACSSFAARQINHEGLSLIKSFEGFRGNFYHDSVGVKTIGYGHACHVHDCSKIHAPISEAQASHLLQQDLASYENCVSNAVGNVDDDKFAALTSFTYNMGCGAFSSSSLAKYTKQHHYKAAAGEFGKWVHAGSQVLPGLVRRRQQERHLFCKSGGC